MGFFEMKNKFSKGLRLNALRLSPRLMRGLLPRLALLSLKKLLNMHGST